MNLKHYRYIVIEGAIGTGKTSLARNIANRLNCATLLEQPQTNPFLQNFYSDMPRHGLSTQLYFLFQRLEQLDTIQLQQEKRHAIVSDFLFDKDQIFAEVTLGETERELYQKIRQRLDLDLPIPDLVIYLQATPEILLKRIKQRGLPMEKGLSEDYLWRLTERYLRFFHVYDQAPVMIINSEHLDFAHREADLDLLLTRIEQMRSAREYFNINE
ncbi:deoxynucleoside kinase [Nitrosomonas mobilis]|uniref:Deoxynucleoside kinase n=1 Tax=Nitrosomonas mobilis TaxID=51642 RepID=A0A1G5SCJ4_9PROT|nr:deoxynucleoside kinase [Nitrosomonas mobilis]SCZ84159.1 Deoxynucleoside kinase [Nitrosomonas mobilis]HNO75287.1 deoxynucleoside kinase [Nitrosomonas mobilis]